MKQVEVGPDGARLGWVEFDGDDPALVFLHGLGACSPIYFARTAVDPVLAGRRAIMIDFLGFGISDKPAGFGYTLEGHADSIARALDTLGLARVDMVPHSMGGSIALVLASRRPDLVGRLVLAEPNLEPSARPRVEPFTEAAVVQFGFEQALTAAGPEWGAMMRLADPVAFYRTELALGRGTTPMMDELLLNLAVPCARRGCAHRRARRRPVDPRLGHTAVGRFRSRALHDAGQSSGLRPHHHRREYSLITTPERYEVLTSRWKTLGS